MSWQNLAFSTFLRLRMKPMSKHAPDIDRVRKATATPMFRPKPPPGWRLVSSLDPPLKGEWTEPMAGQARRTVLYCHGGGYFFCSPETHRPITFGLAAAADARIFSLDYRLAPEHRCPAALDDAVAAYRGLLAHGTAPSRIVLGGDSAGGGLALSTLLALRDAGDPLPAGAVLFSPWTDLAGTGATLDSNDRSDVMFYGQGIREAGKVYLGEIAATDPLASPLYADLSGLPPLFIQASDSEVLLDDSRRFADKARAAGVAVVFRAWPRLPHVWQIFAPALPEARAALAEAGAFIRSIVP
ncbi:MAG TPA: alpha/beta hydrolase [Aliidongia sp.]|nr:alpha/beta hydrolase [Aliidongia sp.]